MPCFMTVPGQGWHSVRNDDDDDGIQEHTTVAAAARD